MPELTIAQALAVAMDHHRAGRLNEAEQIYRQILLVQPDQARAIYMLGIVAFTVRRLDEAIACFARAAELEPANADAFNALGAALWGANRNAEAITALSRAVELAPQSARFHSDYLLALEQADPYDAARVFQAHRQWAQRHADPLAAEIRPHANDRSPDRRLRIGYSSAQFCENAAAFFLEPALAGYDRSQFEVVCYSDVAGPDAATARFQAYADVWKLIGGLPDAPLAEKIRADQIDILVDCTGHLVNNRLLVFARRPAPVQVTYIGYQDTTGLTQIDYRISDSLADPPGMTDPFYSETIVRLPRSGFCYRGPELSPAPIRDPEAPFAFGSTNRLAKLTPQMLELWCRILHAVPRARMIIQSDGLSEPTMQRDLLARFSAFGIGPDRLELIGWTGFQQYLSVFNRIDVILDTFPFNGHTVTCHALWMGVPVVTLAGQTHIARMGLSILTNLGLTELIADSPEQYVRIAVDLAGNRPRLGGLRHDRRARMRASPLMDEAGYSRELGAAYREMWRRWCRTTPTSAT
jgi:protein O-GlcNAc transferase